MAGEFLKHYNQYKDKIYNYFWYRLNFNRAMAEDMTQDVFLKAFDKFDTFIPDRSFQAWIFKISKNHLLNYYRIAGREIGLDDVREPVIDLTVKMNATLELDDVLERIRSLPEKFRDILLLRYVDGLDNKEIAEVLNIEEGAARTRICRALQIIRKKISR